MSKGLRIGINLLILGLVVAFLYYIVTNMKQSEAHYAQPLAEELLMGNGSLTGKESATLNIPAQVNRMEFYKGMLYVVAGEKLYCYDSTHALVNQFALKQNVRDLAISENGEVYILYPTLVEVYSSAGELLREWEACSELSDYCSIALSKTDVYVTDAANKNICQYTTEGNFQRFIKSPNGFVIPSYAFDIVCHTDTLYCVNSGKHLIERYTLKGDYIDSFGKTGAAAGEFAGCCNPTYISLDETGKIITSEKGVNRITKFTTAGAFQEVLFKGSSRTASEITIGDNGVIYVAQKQTVTLYNE